MASLAAAGETAPLLVGAQAYESCERLLSELEVLSEIYGDEFDVSSSSVALLESSRLSCESDPALFDWTAPGLPKDLTITVATRISPSTKETPTLIEVVVLVPRGYPRANGPVVECLAVRCSDLQPAALTSIVRDINNMAAYQWQQEEEYLYSLVQTAVEQAAGKIERGDVEDMASYALIKALEMESQQAALASAEPPVPVLGRRIIFSHHIIADSKRSAVCGMAQELGLGGFSKIGWPGLILVEGDEEACQVYVQHLQRLRWKQLTVRGEQQEKGLPGQSLDDLRSLPKQFVEFGTDGMSDFSQACRNFGLEALLLAGLKLGPNAAKHSSSASEAVHGKGIGNGRGKKGKPLVTAKEDENKAQLLVAKKGRKGPKKKKKTLLDTTSGCGKMGQGAAQPGHEEHSCEMVFCTFHHLLEGKSHQKELDMVSAAKRLGMGGFIMYGTPGIVILFKHDRKTADETAFINEAKKIGKKGNISLHIPCTLAAFAEAGSNGKRGLQKCSSAAALKSILASVGAGTDEYRAVLGIK